MSPPPTNKKEAPTEPFKRTLALTVRAIAGDKEVQVAYGPGKPEIEGKNVSLPEPSRLPTAKEIAVIRGWADSLALTAAVHDKKVHRRLAPPAGPARNVFEAAEKARIEAVGANRMPGMALNLTAKVDDQFGNGRYAEINDRSDAPLEDAIALLLREKLTFAGTVKLIFGKGGWENFFQTELENRQRETLSKIVRESLELIEADLKSVWKQVHDIMQRSFDKRDLPLLPDFARQRKELLDRIDLTLIERTQGAEFQRQMQRVFADTASWLRVPAGVFAAGGIGAVVAAALTKLTILDITGTIAGLGALTGTVVALAKRRRIIGEYRQQMNEKREAMVQAVEDHLRHAVKRFYVDLDQLFQPIEAFSEAQKKAMEPSLAAVRDLEVKLARCSASIGSAVTAAK